MRSASGLPNQQPRPPLVTWLTPARALPSIQNGRALNGFAKSMRNVRHSTIWRPGRLSRVFAENKNAKLCSLSTQAPTLQVPWSARGDDMATAVALAAVVSIRPGVHGVGTAQSLTWHSTRSLGVSAWLCFGSANAGYLFVFVPSPSPPAYSGHIVPPFSQPFCWSQPPFRK